MGFDPSVINPAVGDTIVFEFRSGSHSVVREYRHGHMSSRLKYRCTAEPESSFENPCTPSGGFDTGVQTVRNITLGISTPN